MNTSKVKEALIPAFITLGVFLIIIAVKGIFPFGPLRIDYYDMGQTNAPLYYHIWDFLHGKGSLFYSWYLNEGQNLSMGSSIQWNISVFNLFFLFMTRNAVMKSLSLFLGLHLFFMAFNMNLFLSHTVKTPKLYRILFSVCYGLTGFTLTHYTIPTYLDTAALMPVYLITLYNVLKDEKKKSVTVYALMTGYMAGLGYYMAFMNMIFVLLVSGTYIFIVCDVGGDRKKAVRSACARLAIGTVAGMGLSAFMLLPAAMQMTKSSRFNSNLSGGLYETLHSILWSVGADMYYIKWWLLSGSIAAIVMILIGFVRFRKEIRQNLFVFLFIMYPCALIVFESINLLWHMGTYYHYPIRCGYLIPLSLLTAGAYYIGRSYDDETLAHNAAKRPVMAVLCTVALTVSAGLIIYYQSHDVWPIEDLFRVWIVFALVLAVLYVPVLAVLRRPMYVLPILIVELLVPAFIGYGKPNFSDRFSSDPEQSGDYVVTSQQLASDLAIEESRIDRIKNPDTTLNANYGFIMRRATVSGWANTAPRQQMDSSIALGYGAHFMRILDCGGSMLSDAALHVTQTLTVTPQLYNDRSWTISGQSGAYTLFDNEYTLPFAMKIKDDSLIRDISEMDFSEATNALYRCLSSDENGVIVREITDEICDGTYESDGQRALYLHGGQFDELTINGEVLPIADIGDPDGTSYPAWFNSNVLFLGIFDSESVSIPDAKTCGAKFYEFDVDKLAMLCSDLADDSQTVSVNRSSVDITMKGQSGQTALIPLAYDTGFKAVNNGIITGVINESNIFIAIPLMDGENHIRLSFVPDGLILGVIISAVFLAGTVFFTIKPIKYGIIERICAPLMAIIWGGAVTVLYVIPYISFVIRLIQKLL